MRFLKRLLDIAAAAIALLLLSPLLLLIALAIRVSTGAPVLFRQQRPGCQAQPFTLIKFRTMNQSTDPQGKLLPEVERLTTLGRFLRRLSFDELPQLCNVLQGEMSLVGPRPLLMQYLDRYTPEQARRHAMQPGITGWAQVNGRNHLTWEEKFALDLWYVDHWSLTLDLRILLRTLGRVFMPKGIAPEGEAVMPEFMGNASASAKDSVSKQNS